MADQATSCLSNVSKWGEENSFIVFPTPVDLSFGVNVKPAKWLPEVVGFDGGLFFYNLMTFESWLVLYDPSFSSSIPSQP